LVSAEAAEHSTEFSLDANCSEFCRELQADSDAALSNDTSEELGPFQFILFGRHLQTR
jgi:hypothetical protein